MARTRFLPGFDTAPGPNRVLVGKTENGPIVFGVNNPDNVLKLQAKHILAIRRMIAGPISEIKLDRTAETYPSGHVGMSWWTLKTGMHSWLDGHLENAAIPRYRASFATAKEAKSHVIQAANDGIATDIAFLEVIPKVLFRREFNDPNKEIAAWARSSVGFIIEWAGLDDDVDSKLAWALSSPKPRKKKEVFDDLHFNPKWFAEYPSLRRVGLNGEIVGRLRDENNRHPNAARRAGYVLFACPAPKMIPKLHMTAVDLAQSGGLFERTYLEERANHGYPEAWIALDGLRSVNEQ